MIDYTKKNPKDPDGFYLLGNAYFADNQRDRAIEAYRQCLALNVTFPRAMFNLGYILVLKKDKAGAEKVYNDLVKLDKTRADDLRAAIDKM